MVAVHATPKQVAVPSEPGSLWKRSNLPPKLRFPYAGGRLSAVGYQLSEKHKALKANVLLSCRKPKADCRLPGSRVLDRSFSRCRAAFPDEPELGVVGGFRGLRRLERLTLVELTKETELLSSLDELGFKLGVIVAKFL